MKRWHFYVGLAVVLAVAAAIALPQYGDYRVRASVSEGVLSTQEYRERVAAAIQQKGKLPPPESKGFAKAVRSVSASPNGELRITFQGYRSIEGRSIVQVPKLGPGGIVEGWHCRNIDMPERELPLACRAK